MKKLLTLMIGLTIGTASFAHSTPHQPTNSDARVVMTTDYKLKLYVQPIETKGEIAIRDANGHTLYSTNVSLQKGLRQAFDFSNLGIGTYQLQVKTDNQTITRTFVVQSAPNECFIVQNA